MSDLQTLPSRQIVSRTRGQAHGPIVRLMSPGDLGHRLKPFIFLDYIDGPAQSIEAMRVHPHSGIATTTLVAVGDLRFDDPTDGTGTIDHGGVEWMRSGGGVWHGRELTTGRSNHVIGFQLWIALPPELETAAPDSQYLESASIPSVGPARLILGRYDGRKSPVRAPENLIYMMVTLAPGEHWRFDPPPGHRTSWLAVGQGKVQSGETIAKGELAILEGEGSIDIEADGEEEAIFVLGSAVPHPHDLHIGRYSVHCSAEALRLGEQRIAELGAQLERAGNRQRQSGSTPVYR